MFSLSNLTNSGDTQETSLKRNLTMESDSVGTLLDQQDNDNRRS